MRDAAQPGEPGPLGQSGERDAAAPDQPSDPDAAPSGSEADAAPPLEADAGPVAPAPDAGPVVPPAPDAGMVERPTAASCFAGQSPMDGLPVDYDAHDPIIGAHCKGTDHQDIQGIERVVFVGDSITVGTPPTPDADWYRNRIVRGLVDRWGLEAPGWLWSGVNVVNGLAGEQFSGDFASCAKWGARTDDMFKPPHQQVKTCIPEEERDKTTLVIMTVGGNDLFAWAQDIVAGVDADTIWMDAQQAVADFEEAILWLTEDPTRFPNGMYVVFANTFEFTDVDSGNDLATCPGADIIAMDRGLVDPNFRAAAAWMMDEYMRIAVATGTDMVFLGEHACGHGHMLDDPSGRCYRGPNTELWFDVTCMHPSSAGHAGIADLFLSVIDE